MKDRHNLTVDKWPDVLIVRYQKTKLYIARRVARNHSIDGTNQIHARNYCSAQHLYLFLSFLDFLKISLVDSDKSSLFSTRVSKFSLFSKSCKMFRCITSLASSTLICVRTRASICSGS
eukprot:Selendium_serpulae@DN3328_c0_g1_i3.p1